LDDVRGRRAGVAGLFSLEQYVSGVSVSLLCAQGCA